MTTGEQIVAEARSLLGVRFFHTGRDEKGLDCAGLILCCWHRLGLTTWDDRRYAPGGDVKRLYAGLERFCERVDLTAELQHYASTGPVRYKIGCPLQPGDVLLLAIKAQPIHVAIVTGAGTMIHALDEGIKQVVEVPYDRHWQQRVVSVWRWREVRPSPV